jgi:hypothetical protein
MEIPESLIPTQFYTYKDNAKRENDFFSTQSFPATLSTSDKGQNPDKISNIRKPDHT